VLLEEVPHQLRGVDFIAGLADDEFGQRLAAGPGVTAVLDGVE
jgi:hypothetical protein